MILVFQRIVNKMLNKVLFFFLYIITGYYSRCMVAKGKIPAVLSDGGDLFDSIIGAWRL